MADAKSEKAYSKISRGIHIYYMPFSRKALYTRL
jgi:hypothetical protein